MGPDTVVKAALRWLVGRGKSVSKHVSLHNSRQVVAGRTRLDTVQISDAARERAAQLCMALGTDGLRGDLTLIRAARAYAALQGDAAITDGHFKRIAAPALRHRLRRNPLDDSGSSVRVERAVAELMGS